MTFSENLKALLWEKKEIASYAMLAKKMNHSKSTISHHVSSLGSQKDFGSDFAKALAKQLGMAPDELADALEAKRMENLDIQQVMNDLQIKGAPSHAFYQKRMKELFSNLRKGACYYFATHEPPWEFEVAEFQLVVAETLKRGVNIKYFFPDPRRDENNIQFRSRYSKLIGRADLTWTTLYEGYEQFRDILADDFGLSDPELALLEAIRTPDLFLCNPLQRLAYFKNPDAGDDENDETEHAIIECVFGKESQYESYKIWQPLNIRQTSIVARAFSDAIAEHEKHENK